MFGGKNGNKEARKRVLFITQNSDVGLDQVVLVEGEVSKFWIHKDGGLHQYA